MTDLRIVIKPKQSEINEIYLFQRNHQNTKFCEFMLTGGASIIARNVLIGNFQLRFMLLLKIFRRLFSHVTAAWLKLGMSSASQ